MSRSPSNFASAAFAALLSALPAQQGSVLDCPPSDWTCWWERNQGHFLRVRERLFAREPSAETATRAMRPTDEQVRDDVLPALRAALESSDDPDLTAACLLAIAKAGRGRDVRSLGTFAARLHADAQQVRETAALAIGVAGVDGDDEVGPLVGLALDDAVGRSACGGGVNPRTRSFATHALGLIAHRSSRSSAAQRVLTVTNELLLERTDTPIDVRVAVMHATSLLRFDDTSSGRAMRDTASRMLTTFWHLPTDTKGLVAVAHCPTAIARLHSRGEPAAKEHCRQFVIELQRAVLDDTPAWNAQSCALALGQLATPDDDASIDALDRASLHHTDEQTRYFALLAMGQIGGPRCRARLLDALPSLPYRVKAWCALALGLLRHDERARSDDDRRSAEMVESALTAEFAATRDAEVVGAVSIALGLAGVRDAASAMRDRMRNDVTNDEPRVSICHGLLLMGDEPSAIDIAALVPGCKPRFDLLHTAAVTSAALGNHRTVDTICELLSTEPERSPLVLVGTLALGEIGDARAIAPLLRLLRDRSAPRLVRAMAATASGNLCDNGSAPWFSCIAENTNHRANVPTLSNRSTGILDQW